MQLNPAIKDFKGPTISIHYRRISAIAITKYKDNLRFSIHRSFEGGADGGGAVMVVVEAAVVAA